MSANARVAQLAEQRFDKPQVVGSTPTPSTNNMKMGCNMDGDATIEADDIAIEGFGGAVTKEGDGLVIWPKNDG